VRPTDRLAGLCAAAALVLGAGALLRPLVAIALVADAALVLAVLVDVRVRRLGLLAPAALRLSEPTGSVVLLDAGRTMLAREDAAARAVGGLRPARLIVFADRIISEGGARLLEALTARDVASDYEAALARVPDGARAVLLTDVISTLASDDLIEACASAAARIELRVLLIPDPALVGRSAAVRALRAERAAARQALSARGVDCDEVSGC